MVHLIGVVHEAALNHSLWGPLENIEVKPSKDLICYLSKFKEKTKVGLEHLSEYEFSEISLDLALKNYELMKNRPFKYHPEYSFRTAKYFESLKSICENLGFEVFFLEKKETWLRYNKALVRNARVRAAIYEDILFHSEEESDEEYSKKLYRCNDLIEKSETKLRKIHEIERDKELLDSISKQNLDLVIVGAGHSDLWRYNKDKIKKEFNINFESYAGDETNTSESGHELLFNENPSLDLRLIADHLCLERKINLIETGRISKNGTPDYVGVWNITHPSQGYFELFLDKSENGFKGRIEDCLGSAKFEGEISNEKINFTKKYDFPLSIGAKEDVVYKGISNGEGFYGIFSIDGKISHIWPMFYMKKSHKEKPLNLCMNLDRLFETNKKDFDSLVEEL
jgi:hypothetical protein